jgi:hypothetical protein
MMSSDSGQDIAGAKRQQRRYRRKGVALGD